MDTNSFIKRIDETIDEKWPEMVAMSDAFAAAPEISGREFKTSRKLVDVLEEAGFDVEYPYMGLPTAFKAKAGHKGNGGRAAILTFHSGEDRIVKKAFKAFHQQGIYREIARDVIRPSREECYENSRARSTKLRWAIKA